jgi:hypothetical protein
VSGESRANDRAKLKAAPRPMTPTRTLPEALCHLAPEHCEAVRVWWVTYGAGFMPALGDEGAVLATGWLAYQEAMQREACAVVHTCPRPYYAPSASNGRGVWGTYDYEQSLRPGEACVWCGWSQHWCLRDVRTLADAAEAVHGPRAATRMLRLAAALVEHRGRKRGDEGEPAPVERKAMPELPREAYERGRTGNLAPPASPTGAR